MSSNLPLSEEERRELAAVLDAIVPPSVDGRMPGAGALGLAEPIERAARDAPALGTVLAEGLAALAERARRAGLPGFAALPVEARAPALADLAAAQPAFLPNLVFQTYAVYYRHPRVLEALGLEPRPPHPLGYEVTPFDESLLEPVRRRGSLLRRS